MSLFSLFKRTPESLAVAPGKPFEWRRGLKLQATENIHLIFPAGILIKDKPFSAVIEASSDDTRIAIGEQQDGSFGKVHVFLKAGQNVTLHRNTEAIVAAEDGRARTFLVLARGN